MFPVSGATGNLHSLIYLRLNLTETRLLKPPKSLKNAFLNRRPAARRDGVDIA
jgi:hypothetical protein